MEGLAPALMISLIVFIWVLSCIRILRKDERAVRVRLGHPVSDPLQPLGPGIQWVWWPLETLVRWRVFTGQKKLLGASGEALDRIARGQSGLVRIRGEVWRATADQDIPRSQYVRVTGTEGPNLRVELGPGLKSKAELLDEEIAVWRSLQNLETDAEGSYHLGTLYEAKGDLQTAFEHYRIAHRFDRKSSEFRAAYERLSQQLNRR